MTPLPGREKTGARAVEPVVFTGEDAIEISVIMPCLDEEAAVGGCVRDALEAIAAMGVSGEVVVVDNGSTDSSARRAAAAGARVVHERVAGYGNACRAGLDAARGRVLVLGDADGTYDFSVLSDLVGPLQEAAGLALGSRLRGRCEPGAMPWMHRWVGTPLLTGFVNRLFGTRVSDVNCGLRAVTRGAYEQLALAATGMEFASEMVIEAAKVDVRIAEVPVPYRRRRGGVAKLRTWRDGWRHLRLIVIAFLAQRGVNRKRQPHPPGLPAASIPMPVWPARKGRGAPHADRLRP